MKITGVRTFDAGRRVQGFVDTNAALIGTGVPPSLRAKVDAAVSQLAQYQLDQEAAKAAAKGETVNQAALRTGQRPLSSPSLGFVNVAGFR
jgi:hypothetical protein